MEPQRPVDLENFCREFNRNLNLDEVQVRQNAIRPVAVAPVAEPEEPTLEVTADVATIAEILECPICLNTIIPPIFLCSEGHTVCSECRKKLETCPMCREPFTGIRNRFLEQFLDLCLIPCRNKSYGAGCSVKLPGSEIMEHYKTCEFGPLVCPCCAKEAPYDHFIRHIQKDCEWILEPPERSTRYIECTFVLGIVTRPGGGLIPIWISAYNRNFFCFFKKFDDNWSAWVGLHGSKRECEDFLCEISVVNKIDQTTVVHVGNVEPVRDHKEEKVRGLTFPDKDLRKYYVKNNGDIIVTVKIVKD